MTTTSILGGWARGRSTAWRRAQVHGSGGTSGYAHRQPEQGNVVRWRSRMSGGETEQRQHWLRRRRKRVLLIPLVAVRIRMGGETVGW
jgi:hypothetical protein